MRFIQSAGQERIFRAYIEDTGERTQGLCVLQLKSILANEPGSAKDPFVAGQRYTLALSDRDWDAAGRIALRRFPRRDSLRWRFHSSLAATFGVGVVARLKGDETSARAAFMRARAQQEEEIRSHPDDVNPTF